jgi:hypothetical protein
MWRRRRDDVPRRRVWRVQRRVEARVALTVPPEYGPSAEYIPPEYARATAGVLAGVHQTNGRHGDLMASVFCTTCGEANPEGARYCSRCGTPLVRRASDRGPDTTSTISIGSDLDVDQFDEADADAAAVAALPPGTALLAVRRGPNAGSRFLLDSDLTLVGRHPDSDIFLDDVTVSRRHAELLQDGDKYSIRDLGSLNGTFVNRKRVESAELHDDDEVQIGKYRLTFLQR